MPAVLDTRGLWDFQNIKYIYVIRLRYSSSTFFVPSKKPRATGVNRSCVHEASLQLFKIITPYSRGTGRRVGGLPSLRSVSSSANPPKHVTTCTVIVFYYFTAGERTAKRARFHRVKDFSPSFFFWRGRGRSRETQSQTRRRARRSSDHKNAYGHSIPGRRQIQIVFFFF